MFLIYSHRFTKKYLILCGFWLSPSKPNIAVFLKPLMEQLNKIYNEGFQVEDAEGNEHTIRGMLLMATVDLQAKAICMMMMQYNGGYGCHNCEDPGKSLGRGRRVWPYVGASTLRTHESIVECVHRSVAENKTVMGVKGASAFLMHAPFNMATGFPPDYMHEALMGVMKTLLDLWLSPTNKTKDFYIGRMMSTLNERMQALKVPDTISHRPRSFLVRQHWKASELRSQLLFFSPAIMRDILPTKYYAHYMLLVQGVSKLLGDNISPTDLHHSDLQLDIFRKKFEDLYGEEAQTMNIHLLGHLAHFTRLLGPLWAYSCFGFEGMNGQLRRMLHGTHFVASQITFTTTITPVVHRLGRAMAIRRKQDNVLKLAQRLISHSRRGKTTKLAPGTYAIGKVDPRPITPRVEDAIKDGLQNLGKEVDTLEAQVFHRLELQGFTLYSSEYGKEKSSNNRTVEYRDDQRICFGEVVLFCCTHGENLAVVRSFIEADSPLVNAHDVTDHEVRDALTNDLNRYVVEVIPTERLQAIPISSLYRKCVFVSVVKGDETLNYVCRFPNMVEPE
ncbi:Hypp9343 [Branchiostoma lanceolatum]|uniref:Hypp9343 protein n=1 Tax=Branchiostoma lanceolatum TaxID=7740 RepID=A0A8S4MLS7_BRALA|nr:Hypp9343 [Branchiostoma lanceolatum]